MNFELLLLLCSISFAHAIINGTDANPGEFPYMVSLQWDGKHKCGGILINKDTVLTAGHCYTLIYVDKKQPKKATALMGTVDQTSDSGAAQRRTLGRPIFLDGFKEDWKTNKLFTKDGPNLSELSPYDYLLFKLDSPVAESETIKYATLPEGDRVPAVGDNCKIMGWGRYKSPDVNDWTLNDFPTNLQKGNVKVLNNVEEICEDMTKLLCLQQRKKAGVYQGIACFGDSGSPMECEKNGKKYVAGITEAAAVPCNEPDHPAFFLPIITKKAWIKRNK